MKTAFSSTRNVALKGLGAGIENCRNCSTARDAPTSSKPVIGVAGAHDSHRTRSSTSRSEMENNNSNSNGAKSVQLSKQPELAREAIRKSNVVCFDVDSTVITEEGIDELAAFCAKGDEVARVTREAMAGGMSFQQALQTRLNIIRPTLMQIEQFKRERPSTLTRNVQRFIEQLRADGKQVYLISGGFDCLIEPIATRLGIPLSNLYANRLLFDEAGNYTCFDIEQPTSSSGGKAVAIKRIKQQQALPDQTVITMIGDGFTDLEAAPPADYFIGFGGNQQRAAVYQHAKCYISDFKELIH